MYYAIPRRNSVGVRPVVLRNAAENELVSAKPTASATSVTERVVIPTHFADSERHCSAAASQDGDETDEKK